jgi:hypothetical protein
MALGAGTKIDSYVIGNKRVKVYDFVLGTGANYPTGGEPLAASLVGLRRIISVKECGVAKATSGGATARTVSYDYTNNKLQIYTTGSAEAANNSDQSTITARLEIIGY